MDKVIVKAGEQEDEIKLPQFGTVTVHVKNGAITRATVEESYIFIRENKPKNVAK